MNGGQRVDTDKPSHYHVSLAGTYLGEPHKTLEEAERVAYKARSDLSAFKKNKLKVQVIKCACRN